MNKKTKYHGFLWLPRQVKHLLDDLGPLYFGIYLALILEAVWDPRKDSYNYVLATNVKLGKLLQCNPSTASRYIKSLQVKHYVIKGRGRLRVADLGLFEQDIATRLSGKDFANVHEVRAAVQGLYADLQGNRAPLHNNEPENSIPFNVSSKVELNSFNQSPSSPIPTENVDPDEAIKAIDEQRTVEPPF